ncbi:hypothetical protein DPMN_023902 [Dreissena polymorpha]|uniref:Uncharacterized protein n=1 Tax=Dreissena polymorpha TaxID=45954 RepID=A0A9D4LN42_DREPO|nr:hypothetical protein DPMN_023902 [Dreissena polymorpha]
MPRPLVYPSLPLKPVPLNLPHPVPFLSQPRLVPYFLMVAALQTSTTRQHLRLFGSWMLPQLHEGMHQPLRILCLRLQNALAMHRLPSLKRAHEASWLSLLRIQRTDRLTYTGRDTVIRITVLKQKHSLEPLSGKRRDQSRLVNPPQQQPPLQPPPVAVAGVALL